MKVGEPEAVRRRGRAGAPTGLEQRRLYLVTDDHTPSHALPGLVGRACAGGVDMVQLRRKDADRRELVSLARSCLVAAHDAGALFLVNDYPDVAEEVGADGVHLGQDSDLSQVREGRHGEMLLGVSTRTPEQLKAALRNDPDYVSAGPVFATPTKPGREAVGYEYVRKAAAISTVPVVAIGGLESTSSGMAVEAGADIVAVVRALCLADDPKGMARKIRAEVDAASRWWWLTVNGQPRKCPPGSSADRLLTVLGVRAGDVVVEVNGEILERSELDKVLLSGSDTIEIVHFVGGG